MYLYQNKNQVGCMPQRSFAAQFLDLCHDTRGYKKHAKYQTDHRSKYNMPNKYQLIKCEILVAKLQHITPFMRNQVATTPLYGISQGIHK
jgi:hypothetical protein